METKKVGELYSELLLALHSERSSSTLGYSIFEA